MYFPTISPFLGGKQTLVTSFLSNNGNHSISAPCAALWRRGRSMLRRGRRRGAPGAPRPVPPGGAGGCTPSLRFGTLRRGRRRGAPGAPRPLPPGGAGGCSVYKSYTITSIPKFPENCNSPNILNPYSPSSNHPQCSFIAIICHDPIPSED